MPSVRVSSLNVPLNGDDRKKEEKWFYRVKREKVKVWKIEKEEKPFFCPIVCRCGASRVEHFVITRFLCKSKIFRCYRRSQIAWKAFAASALLVFRRNMLGSQPLSLPYFVAFAPWLSAPQGKFHEIPESTTQTSNPRFRKLFYLQERRVAELFNSISQISSRRESIYFSAERQCCEHEIKIQFPRRWTLNFYYKSIKTLLSASCEVFWSRKNCSKSNPSKWHDEWQFLLFLACRKLVWSHVC